MAATMATPKAVTLLAPQTERCSRQRTMSRRRLQGPHLARYRLGKKCRNSCRHHERPQRQGQQQKQRWGEW